FVVGGQGQLSKTPLWEGLDRARKELGRSDLRLKPADTSRLGSILGVTHVATGTVRGSASQCSLTYQMWQISGHKPVGAALTLSGSAVQVLQQLPTMASTLSRQLGVTAPHIPASVGATFQE